MQHGTHGEYSNHKFSGSVRLWAVSYRCVELNSFLFVDLLHISSTQLARDVRHGFVHPFLGFVLCSSHEYLEGFWCVRLESQWVHLYHPTVIVNNDNSYSFPPADFVRTGPAMSMWTQSRYAPAR